MNDQLDVRNNGELIKSLINADIIINKGYLSCLSDIEPIKLNKDIENIDITEVCRVFKLTKLMYDKDEDSMSKVISIINAVGSTDASIATIIKNDGTKAEYYLCIINKTDKNEIMYQAKILEGTFKGNFNGSRIENINKTQINEMFDEIFDEEEECKVVSSIAGVGGLRDSKITDGKKYIQGLEKFVESTKGQVYTAILLADPIGKDEIEYIRNGYENLYSQVSPFMNTNLTVNDSDTLSFTEGENKSIAKSINTNISLTNNSSETSGWSVGESESKVKKDIRGTMLSGATSIMATMAPGKGVLGNSIELVVGKWIGDFVSESLFPDTTKTESIGLSGSSTTGVSETNGMGESISDSIGTSLSQGNSNTRGRSIQINYEDKRIKNLTEKIDIQLKRLNSCDAFGGFKFSAYIISNSRKVNNNVAFSYNSLMRGEESFVESSVISTWENSEVLKYLSKLTHPVFNLKDCGLSEQLVTSTSIISGKELSMHIMLPKKSILGLPVLESVGFGRNVFKLSNKKTDTNNIVLGKIYHMGEVEKTSINLDVKSLAMHTFVTGSTGAGKSNTIYKLLDELNNKEISFLVVEPAKGEYKNVFGHRKDVSVFGTNPKKTKILKINPFEFNEDIHILEHIDKLVEIFNVCWPMYAAMPAVLKEAVESAYVSAGWDLNLSVNRNGIVIYPSFEDVLVELNNVIGKSEFSEELKGNYIGSLATRVKSLTNGINGLIFSNDSISDEILFDSNVIVDLSRIGSIETKSLIMGILILKLQEYRMAQGGMNIPLKHVTVLEEAHNILKRTSTEQSSEGSNMLGKSVEMLSNSIAEMRTYGEGFIIADQSPNMLDMAAIRNTNTKIVMRLPEKADRDLVGKAIGLTEAQIDELVKLETGVAAVYQNNWLESVLCKVDEVKVDEKIFIEEETNINANDYLEELIKTLIDKVLNADIGVNTDCLIDKILKSSIYSSDKLGLIKFAKSKENLGIDKIYKIISEAYYTEVAFEMASKCTEMKEWNEIFISNLQPSISHLETKYQNTIVQCILKEKAMKFEEFKEFYFGWSKYIREGY